MIPTFRRASAANRRGRQYSDIQNTLQNRLQQKYLRDVVRKGSRVNRPQKVRLANEREAIGEDNMNNVNVLGVTSGLIIANADGERLHHTAEVTREGRSISDIPLIPFDLQKLRHSKLSSSVPTETNRTESESTEPQQSSRKRRRSEYKIDAFKTSGFIEHMARGKKKIRQARPNPNLLLIASEAPLTQLPIESRVGMSSGANSGMYTQSIPDKSRNNKRSLEPSLVSPFLGDNLYWTTTTNRKMHIQPENSPQSGELRQVVVHSQERTSWIPPDKRATEKLQRQREIERYDAPKELPSSAPQQSRHSPSSKILIRSSQHSPLYINEQQSHRNQPVATQPDPVLPSQFYAPSQPRVRCSGQSFDMFSALNLAEQEIGRHGPTTRVDICHAKENSNKMSNTRQAGSKIRSFLDQKSLASIN
ncbi:unnamed protein product [Toxocara canis]|uniref:Uncharacterized protein n=1 Tax=Toxocara canis TaxID=6265 RepID=A0A183V3V1_TOXCA|nr:unnamed protein product [Toxocara canis]